VTAPCYLRYSKATLSGCLLALCATGASASDKINADDWVAQCAATEEPYGWCAATVSEVVKLVDNYQYQYPHFIVCWKPQPLAPVGDLPTAAQMSWFRKLVSATVQYVRDNP
jgi:diadenosine tetraphosphate (Ap4A) HIT family hydrolase